MKYPEQLMFMKNAKAVQKESCEMMEGKWCIISGATSGVGLETVRRFAKAQANIVMVCRDRMKAQQVQEEIESNYGVKITYVLADFANLGEVRRAAQEVLNIVPRIDVLVNSVGIYATKKEYNADGLEKVFVVNHLSVFLFTYLLLDKLKMSAPARIIQVNSEGHRFNGLKIKDLGFRRRIYTGLRSYGQSKTAQLLTVWEFAERLRGSGVTINAMHPGAVKTNIGSNNGKLYRWFLRNVTWKFLKDASISGSAMHYLATAKELEEVSATFFHLTIPEQPAKHARNKDMQQKVWDMSMELTKLNKE